VRKLALVMDTETTGLVENMLTPLARQPEVIEFCGMVVDLGGGPVIEEMDQLIRPSRMPLPAKIVKITGITDDALQGAPAFGDVSDMIFGMIESVPLVIAHNASFDRDMLDLEARRLGRQIAWPPVICTVEATVAIKGHRMSLAGLHEELMGQSFSGAHRARTDVSALVRCVVRLSEMGAI